MSHLIQRFHKGRIRLLVGLAFVLTLVFGVPWSGLTERAAANNPTMYANLTVTAASANPLGIPNGTNGQPITMPASLTVCVGEEVSFKAKGGPIGGTYAWSPYPVGYPASTPPFFWWLPSSVVGGYGPVNSIGESVITKRFAIPGIYRAVVIYRHSQYLDTAGYVTIMVVDHTRVDFATNKYAPGTGGTQWTQTPANYPAYNSNYDSDGDGLPDAWEITYFGNLSQSWSGDGDNDGVSNSRELAVNFNPANGDTDGDTIPDAWEAANLGKFAVYSPSLTATLFRQQTSTSSIILNNDTAAAVSYSVALSNNTAPAYSYKDSISGGVPFDWTSIASEENRLSEISDSHDADEKIHFGFQFPFSEQSYSSVWVSSNGMITFETNGGVWPDYDEILPSKWAPEKMIAPLWCDIDPRGTGNIYSKTYPDRVVVQYDNVYLSYPEVYRTFQVILYSNGDVKFLYKSGTTDMGGYVCNIGIQDYTLGRAVQIPKSAMFNGSDVAFLISPVSDFFSMNPLTGIVAPKSSASVTGSFRSLDLPAGIYDSNVSISNNSQGTQPTQLMARLKVKWEGEIAMTAPATGQSILQGDSVHLAAKVSDSRGIGKVEFWSGALKIGDALTPSDVRYETTAGAGLPAGTHQIFARAVDTAGLATESSPVTLIVIADTDLDGIPDEWETAHGFNPDDPNDAELDGDGDGLSNRQEYLNGGDPAVPQIHSFAETHNPDGTITYTWVSHVAQGGWFRIEDELPDGTRKTLYSTTYGSPKLPYVPGSTHYSITLDPATDYNP